jgi:hypothetical protein
MDRLFKICRPYYQFRIHIHALLLLEGISLEYLK